uniref:mannosyl-oligosaccharide 1,3-1,6-alpha-mannosidase n=1 Tax=Romanomermis culicivorax TaxID=13658 RepID=A0A915L3E9_ROMCU
MLKFDNLDGGVWKQGWNVTYDRKSLENEQTPKLKVFVVPHSHCDPGWIKTFDEYYKEQTKHILDGMTEKLDAESRMKFIYAEISFFERWWRDAGEEKRQKVKNLIKSGQFEIVTGAWVMTDEANSHYFATIDQIIEGNQWVYNHLDFIPKNHWSIDPFGLTPTMAHFTKLAGLSSMAVQRVHYSVKKYLAMNKKLEFYWRQLWNENQEQDMFCHIFPFYSYDVPHTCGPEPKVCCQFDFRRLPGFGMACPWQVAPSLITEKNVEERAFTLLDQYRKKAQLYKTEVLLVPLGDDFRYDSAQEWDHQFENYQKLFDFMNKKTEWNVEARFGTLNDYFKSLDNSVSVKKGSSSDKKSYFPVLSGDFFTYADRDHHYWSGYYTTRPFYKRMDRLLQQHLRAAEIIFSLANTRAKKQKVDGFKGEILFPMLVNARRNMGLFQHHDGVTGTAKDNVMMDYGHKYVFFTVKIRSKLLTLVPIHQALKFLTLVLIFWFFSLLFLIS